MLDSETKRRIDTARDILVGKVPDPKSQVEQITIALIYKFMEDMDAEAEEIGGERTFFKGDFEKYSWSRLLAPNMGGYDVLNLYSESIQNMNLNPNMPQLFRDIFKNAYLPYRDPETLKSFLKIINEFEYDHSERLGDSFEYLLSVLGSQGEAGQFRTPRNIIDFMIEVMEPKKNESILDPACGTAGFLISSHKHILNANAKAGRPGASLTPDERNWLAKNIIGYDISPDMVRLSLVNMYLHSITSPKIFEYDTLTSEDRWNEYYDIIMANPPFMSPKGGIKPHKRFSVQSSRSEVLFVDYIAEHLSTTGRAAVIVPEGIIFQSQNSYKKLRKMLVDKYLFAVVSLPAGVFNPYSGVKTSILLIDKNLSKKADKLLFVKIENDGFGLGAQRRPNGKNDIPESLDAIKEYQHTLREDKEFCADQWKYVHVVEKKKIAENGDYNLSGERYKIDEILSKSDYIVVRLGDIADTSSGGTPAKKNIEYYKHGNIPWIKSGELSKGIIRKSEEFITEEGLRNSSAKIFPKNTVLVAMYGATAGQVGILKIGASTNQAICGIFPNENVIPEYLYLILKNQKKSMTKLTIGGAQPNITQKIVRDLKIPLPPLSVQKEIVAEIEGYQKIINGARQVVDNYKPLINIDPDWETAKIDDLFNITYGLAQSIPKNLDQNGIKIISTAETNLDGSMDLSKIRKIKYLKKYDKYILKPDTLLFNWRNAPKHVGKTVLFNEKGDTYIYASFLLNLTKKNDDVNNKFYWIILNHLRTEGYFKRMSRQAVNQTNFNAHELSKTVVCKPDLDTQNKIVAQIEKEQELVNANKELIRIFEQKIKDKIASVWGEEKEK